MKSIETSIIIQSSPEMVWNELMNFSEYHEWNPFIKSITGKAEINAPLKVQMTLEDNGKPMTMTPLILELAENKVFCWEGNLFVKGLFDGRHRFELIPLKNGTTKFVQSETFGGLLVSPIMKLVGKKTLDGFNAMNKALKIRIEENSQLKKAS